GLNTFVGSAGDDHIRISNGLSGADNVIDNNETVYSNGSLVTGGTDFVETINGSTAVLVDTSATPPADNLPAISTPGSGTHGDPARYRSSQMTDGEGSPATPGEVVVSHSVLPSDLPTYFTSGGVKNL